MKIKNEKYFQDETGQWWFEWGIKQKRKTRCTIQICRGCEEEYLSPGSGYNEKTKFCSRQCSCRHIGGGNKAEKHYSWNGGRRINSKGYVEIWIPPEKRRKKRIYELEHRIVMEKFLGRYLLSNENIHHKNGVKDDNRIVNLELWIKHSRQGINSEDCTECPKCHGKGYILKEDE